MLTDPMRYDCQDHIRHLSINYSCIDSDPHGTRIKNLYLIEKNFEKYFLKIRDQITNYELALEKSLKMKNIVINLLYHKVVNGRYVGIYKFSGHKGTLENAILKNNLTKFEKYNYMKRITSLVMDILKDRDPKSLSLDLNLTPGNILLLKMVSYKIKLIDPLASTQREKDAQHISDEVKNITYVNAKARNVFLLGKLFFFICFGHHPSKGEYSLEKMEILNNLEENTNRHDFDIEIIKLIRVMLNASSVDRPSLNHVLDTLNSVQNGQGYYFQMLKNYFRTMYIDMFREIHAENFINNLKNEDDIDQEQFSPENLQERFKSFCLKFKKLYSNFPELLVRLRDFYSDLSEVSIKRVYHIIGSIEVFNESNKDNKFGMISHLTRADIFSDDSIKDFQDEITISENQQIYFDFYLDQLLMGEEIITTGFVLNKRVEIFEWRNNLVMILNDEEKKKYMLKSIAQIQEIFLLSVYEDLQLFFDKIENNSDLSFLLSESVVDQNDFVHLGYDNRNFFEYLHESLSQVRWLYVIMFVFSLGLISVFVMSFYLRSLNAGVYKKSDFTSYIKY